MQESELDQQHSSSGEAPAPHLDASAPNSASRRPTEASARLALSIEEQVALFASAWAHSPQGAAFFDPNRIVRAANETFASQIRVPLEQIVGRPAEEVLPGWAEQVGHRYDEVRNTGRAFHAEDYPYRFPNQPERGITYWVSAVSPVYGRQGEFLGWLLLQREVTNRKRAEDALRFLSLVSAELANSLDYETTLQRIARLAVPTFADHCVVDVLSTDESPPDLVVASVDPAHEQQIRDLRRRYPVNLNVPHSPVAAAIRTGQMQFLSELRQTVIDEIVSDPEDRASVRSTVARTAIIVPLIARGKTLGVITFGSRTPGRYGQADLVLAEDLAGRCALAIDNARLFQQAQRSRVEAAERAERIAEFNHLIAHDIRQPAPTPFGHVRRSSGAGRGLKAGGRRCRREPPGTGHR